MKGLLYSLLVASLAVIILVQSMQLEFADWRANYLQRKQVEHTMMIDSLESQVDTLTKTLAVEVVRYHPETMWLARGIYSETDRPDEMEYVGWVIRNRVELEFRGKNTYRGVVLDEYQFSAFNTGNKRRWYYVNKSVTDDNAIWLAALDTALRIRLSDGTERPIPKSTTHFYSEISMVPSWKIPKWVPYMEQVETPDVEEKRFRFYQSEFLIERM